MISERSVAKCSGLSGMLRSSSAADAGLQRTVFSSASRQTWLGGSGHPIHYAMASMPRVSYSGTTVPLRRQTANWEISSGIEFFMK